MKNINRRLLFILLVLTVFEFVSCSEDDESPAGEARFYLKEVYINGILNSDNQFDSKRRIIRHNIDYATPRYVKYMYPTVGSFVTHSRIGSDSTTTTYTLNDKGLALNSISETSTVVKNKQYEYDSKGYLVETIEDLFVVNQNITARSVITNKIEKGNVVETKNSFDTTTWITTFQYSSVTENAYIDWDSVFGKKRINRLEESTFSGYVPGAGKAVLHNKFSNYVTNKDGLVESFTTEVFGTINGVAQPKVISNYKYVYGKF